MTHVYRYFLSSLLSLGEFIFFVSESIFAFWYGRNRFSKLNQSIMEIGCRCIVIVLIIGLFTGMVMGLQMYYVLVKFGADAALGTAVSLSIIRELGPVLTALMIVGQSGSALSSEIGIMRNDEQVDALETMGIDSKGFLCGPRIYAGLICFPILTAFFDLIGILGGYFSGCSLMGLDADIYWKKVFESVQLSDVYGGFLKSFIFGFITISTCTYEGYYAHLNSSLRGVRGVTLAATKAVVKSSVLILIFDFLITSFLL
jgi:phospholipid/cholesterol/gamma-HCH transport system permease protein